MASLSMKNVSLLDLSDDLLLEIIKQMSVESRLRLATVHPQLGSLVECSWPSVRKSPPFFAEFFYAGVC